MYLLKAALRLARLQIKAFWFKNVHEMLKLSLNYQCLTSLVSDYSDNLVLPYNCKFPLQVFLLSP